MKTKFGTKELVLLGLLAAIVMIFSFTPYGTFAIGPLSITLNIIPIAIAAIALGPIGGLIIGSLFGLLSFLQCYGVGVLSGMGAILVDINPFLAFVQRFVPRALDGLLVGFIFKGVSKISNNSVGSFVTGFFSAFLNTLLFMTALLLLFGNTDYVQGLRGGKSALLFIVTFVGVNAVVEMVVSTLLSGLIGSALSAAKLIPASSSKKSE